MEKIIVELCMGTTCFVMGASSLSELSEQLSEHLSSMVQITHSPCIGLCKDRKYGRAPYVRVNGEVISEASLPKLLAVVNKLAGNAGAEVEE